MPRRAIRASPVALVAVLLALTACPGGRRGPPPERFVPAAARAALLLPETGRAARDLAALHATFSGFPGAGDATALRGAVAVQLGFDPLDPEALERAGFDPKRGAAVGLAAGEGEPVLLVLPVRDAAKVEGLLARLARERLSAEVRTGEPRGPASVVSFRRAAGEPPALAYALLSGYALLAAGPRGAEAVGAAAELPEQASLAAAPAWTAARRALGDGGAALAWLPAATAATAGLVALRDGAALALSAVDGRLRLRAAVLLGDRAAAAAKLAGKGAARAVLARLDPGAALVARLDGDPAALGERLLHLVPARERAALAARGIDLEKDVLAVLAPGGAVSASLSPAFSLVGLTGRVLRDDPPRAVELEAVLPVREGAAEATARWARYADPVRPPAAGPDGVVRVVTASGEIAWKLGDGRLFLACGRTGRLDALLARLGGAGPGWRPPVEDATSALEGGLGGLVLDVPRLASAVRALPPTSFGTGPTGFIVRSAIDRFVEPALRIRALWARADLAEGALVVTLEADVRAPEGSP